MTIWPNNGILKNFDRVPFKSNRSYPFHFVICERFIQIHFHEIVKNNTNNKFSGNISLKIYKLLLYLCVRISKI